MKLNDLHFGKEISVRAYRVCLANGIYDVDGLVKLYHTKQNFFSLRNCGRRTNEELIAVCLRYSKSYIYNAENKPIGDKYEQMVLNLSPLQIDITNCYVQIQLKKLSARSHNALSFFLNQNFDIVFLSRLVLDNPYFVISEINNVGRKSLSELQHFLANVTEFLEKIAVKESSLKQIRHTLYAQLLFDIKQIPTELSEHSCVFRWFDYLLQQDHLFGQNERVIFREGFFIYTNNNGLSIDELSEKLQLTRERIRQIRNRCMANLFSKLLFVRHFNDDLLDTLPTDGQHAWKLDKKLYQSILQKSDTLLSHPMVTYLIYVYWHDRYELVGNPEDVLFCRNFQHRDRHNWSNLYLVSKGTNANIDINAIANELCKCLHKRMDCDCEIQLDQLISTHLIESNPAEVIRLRPIIKAIAEWEFGLKTDRNGRIKLQRNTRKLGFEFAYEALELLGKPSNVYEITKQINKLYPTQKAEPAKVRTALKREHGIVPMGRNNSFALKKWEQDFDDFKVGTIREIAETYLEMFDTPVDHHELAEHVLKYRPSSSKYSIWQNLKLEASKSFVFFRDNKIGLTHKQYQPPYDAIQSPPANKKSWEERHQQLTQFIDQHGRLPYSSHCPEEEIVIYRWYKTQALKMKRNSLDEEKHQLIAELHKQYELNSKTGRRKIAKKPL